MSILRLLPLLLLAGCASYHERFTYFGANGATNHVVDVGHRTFMMFGSAAKLKTETQTMEFIRTVNAEGIVVKPDADTVKALSEGVTAAIAEAMKRSVGLPQ